MREGCGLISNSIGCFYRSAARTPITPAATTASVAAPELVEAAPLLPWFPLPDGAAAELPDGEVELAPFVADV